MVGLKKYEIFNPFNLMEFSSKDTVYLVQLIFRKKYASNLKFKLDMPSDRVLRHQLITEDSLYKIEEHFDIDKEKNFYDKNKILIPKECLSYYFTLNPLSQRTATFLMMSDLIKRIENNDIPNKLDSYLYKFLYKSDSNRKWIHIDIDAKDDLLLNKIKYELGDSKYIVIETRGGYHILLNNKKIDPIKNKTFYKNIKSFNTKDVEVEINSKGTIIPFFWQGGWIPQKIES